MRLPLHIVITTHSQFGREQNMLLFYSLQNQELLEILFYILGNFSFPSI